MTRDNNSDDRPVIDLLQLIAKLLQQQESMKGSENKDETCLTDHIRI